MLILFHLASSLRAGETFVVNVFGFFDTSQDVITT
jgi:hypothetical protein